MRPRFPLLAGNRGFKRSRKNDRISTRRASQESDLTAAYRASAFVGKRDHVSGRWHRDTYAGSRTGEQNWQTRGLLSTAVGAPVSTHCFEAVVTDKPRTWAYGLGALGQMTLQGSSFSCRWRVPRASSRGIGALPIVGDQTEFLDLDVNEPTWGGGAEKSNQCALLGGHTDFIGPSACKFHRRTGQNVLVGRAVRGSGPITKLWGVAD